MPKRYNRCYMTSWIIAFMSRRQSRELPTHSYISLKITLKIGNCELLNASCEKPAIQSGHLYHLLFHSNLKSRQKLGQKAVRFRPQFLMKTIMQLFMDTPPDISRLNQSSDNF